MDIAGHARRIGLGPSRRCPPVARRDDRRGRPSGTAVPRRLERMRSTMTPGIKGMKLSLLDLGRIDTDDGFFMRGCNAAVQSNPNPQYERRRVAVIAAVIEHPKHGPILFETGCAQNAKEEWPAPAYDAFPLNVYEERHHLDKALEAAGYGIDDINAIVIGHLHLDHAGGLEHFRGKNIPIYAHDLEIKEHYYAVATKEDIGPYVPGDLNWELNWQPIHREETELFEGITL